MKTQFIAAVLAALAVAGTTGCTSTNVSQMPGSWTPKPMAPGSYTVLNDGNLVSGSVKVDMLNSSNNNNNESTMRQAVNSALAQCPGADALIDITQDSRMTQKTLMLGPFMIPKEYSYTVFITGIPVKTKE